MSKLTNIMDDSIYLARDYSSIIKWFVRKLKFLTTDWTDLSISEPDTLTLSLISYVFDLINYKIDHKYLDTILSNTKSIKYLSDLYKLIGEEIVDYESGIITLEVNNRSSEIISIDKYEILQIKDHPNELFTSTNSYKIYPGTYELIKVIRGTPIYSNFKKLDIINGLFTLSDPNINRNMINVIIDGSLELSKCEDAIFESGLGFSVIQSGNNLTQVRLSPSAYRLINDNVIVIYNLNDTYLLAENSEIVRLKDPSATQYSIHSITTNDTNKYTINQLKLKYYNLLQKIDTLINDNYDNSIFNVGRIDYNSYNYIRTINFKSGNINYETGELDYIY